MPFKWNPFTGSIDYHQASLGLINVKDYGAIGNGTTDDAAAINAANTAAAALGGNGGVVYFPPGTYYIASTVTFTTHVFGQQAQINTDQDITAITIGTTSALTTKKYLDLPAVRNTAKVSTGWTGSSIGVKAQNVQSCVIRYPEIRAFVTGLLMTSNGSRGNVYNRVEMGVLYDNKVQLKLAPSDVDAWVNENLFLGGRFLLNSAEGTAVSGVKQVFIDYFPDANANIPNNNTFLHLSLEGDVPEYHVDINTGSWNYFRDCRWEATPPKINIRSFSATRYSQRNAVQGGYLSENIVYTEDANNRWNIRPDDIYQTTITLTHAQVLASNTTPITIVPAAGSGKAIVIERLQCSYTYGGTAAYSYTGSYVAVYAVSTGVTCATVGTDVINQTADTTKTGGPTGNIIIKNNEAVVIRAGTANPTLGNANNTVKFKVWYRIVPYSL